MPVSSYPFPRKKSQLNGPKGPKNFHLSLFLPRVGSLPAIFHPHLQVLRTTWVGKDEEREALPVFPHTHILYISRDEEEKEDLFSFIFLLKGETAACHVHIFFRDVRRPKV